ncbi:hypothetical protein JCM19236_6201 [Vibrio sp. JCM 19236]|nr:hypothetical protein JCM19236_6201 [Vibrio sp. JCM 19236]
MKKLGFISLGIVLSASSSLSIATEQVIILDYLVDPVFVCYQNDECNDIERGKLPDPEKTKLVVSDYDKSEQMLGVDVEGKKLWFDQTEVLLNQTAKASIICSTQTLTASEDKKAYVSYGLGEGCH